MCTAHAPFRAESALAVLRRVCEDTPRPIGQINPDIPGWLAGIIEKLHAKKPADRFQSAGEVADLLGKCLAHLQQPAANSVVSKEAAELSLTGTARNRRARWPAALLRCCLDLGVIGVPPVNHWMDERAPVKKRVESQRAVQVPVHEVKTSFAPAVDEEPLERQMEKIRASGIALEKELKQSPAPGYGDPTNKVPEEPRRMDVLEKDLTAPAPRLKAGALSFNIGEAR